MSHTEPLLAMGKENSDQYWLTHAGSIDYFE